MDDRAIHILRRWLRARHGHAHGWAMHLSRLAALSAYAATQDHVVDFAELHARGFDKYKVCALIRSGVLRRLFRQVYLVDADVFEVIPRRSLLRGGLKRYGKDAILWGESAAEVLGIEGCGFPGKPWVMLPLQQACPRDPLVRLRFRHPNPTEVTVVHGLPVTIAVRTVADLVPQLDRRGGLSVVDSALHHAAISVDELDLVCQSAKGRRGAPRVREMCALADGRAANPLESRVRLACIDGLVPPDELQWPVRDRHGVLLGYADLAWVRNRRRPLLGEADGKSIHALPEAVYRDRRRHNDFSGAAADTVRFVWQDSTAYIVSTIRKALRVG